LSNESGGVTVISAASPLPVPLNLFIEIFLAQKNYVTDDRTATATPQQFPTRTMRRGRLFLNSSISKLLGNHEPPTPQQLTCLHDRQQQTTSPLLLSTGICRYGHPQVIVNSPVDIQRNKTFSAMIRLTCPHLIKEIDILEREGGVAKFNHEIAPTEEAKEDFLAAHQTWNEVRRISMNEKEIEFVKKKFGEDSENFFSCGFIGIKIDKSSFTPHSCHSL
jgi:hypothetical protein